MRDAITIFALVLVVAAGMIVGEDEPTPTTQTQQ